MQMLPVKLNQIKSSSYILHTDLTDLQEEKNARIKL